MFFAVMNFILNCARRKNFNERNLMFVNCPQKNLQNLLLKQCNYLLYIFIRENVLSLLK